MTSTTRRIPRLSKREFEFVLLKELENYNPSPVNTMIFSRDGKYLLSGGDDETVRVWNLDTFECDQVIKNKDWGQVTALTLMYPEGDSSVLRSDVPHLCVGSARGVISIFPMERAGQPFTQEKCVTTALFSFNDPVLLQAYDASHSRLAVASQSGDIKMFSVEQSAVSLPPLWSSKITDTPAALLFHGENYNDLLTLAIESSELCSRDANTGEVSWTKEFRGGASGTAALADDNTTLLISNLSTGNFDLYQLPDSTPLRSLPMLSARRYTKQCSFLQGSPRFAVCGSDSNNMSVVDVSQNEVVATLATGQDAGMTQTVASSTTGSPRTLLAGASGGMISLYERVAVKKPSFVQAFPVHKVIHSRPQTDSNTKFILVFVLLVTYANWAPPLLSFLQTVADFSRSLVAT